MSRSAELGSFTKLYADCYAKAGIRMNNILPGFITGQNILMDGGLVRDL